MFTERTSIGLDVHARSVNAAALDVETGEVLEARLTPGEVIDWVARVAARHGPVRVTYEAGPTGYGLARQLLEVGFACQVAAPSKLLRPWGNKVKTDRQDAMLLARLARNDDIVAVRIPLLVEEQARDVVRARDDARTTLMAARHRVSKLLLRHGFVYPKDRAWTKVHDGWLRQVRLDLTGGTQSAFDDAYDALQHAQARRDRLDIEIEMLAADSPFTPVTRRLGCLRGIATHTALGLAVEIGDWDRFTGATIGSFLGLVPSENSSGDSRSQGAITKAGNGHARRLLVEAAWHHRSHYQPGVTIRQRWALAPAAAAARGDQGNQRLHQRWVKMLGQKKRPVIINTAIAREMAGWCWSLATMDD